MPKTHFSFEHALNMLQVLVVLYPGPAVVGVSLCGPVLSSSCRTLTTQRLPPHPGGFGRTRSCKNIQNPSEYHIVFHFNCRSAALRRDSPAICIVSTLLAPISCQGTWHGRRTALNLPKLIQTPSKSIQSLTKTIELMHCRNHSCLQKSHNRHGVGRS